MLATIKTFYPAYGKDLNDAAAKITVALWYTMLQNENNEIIFAGLMNHIAESKFAPAVAELLDEADEIKDVIRTLLVDAKVHGTEMQQTLKLKRGELMLTDAVVQAALVGHVDQVQRMIKKQLELNAPAVWDEQAAARFKAVMDEFFKRENITGSL